MLGGGENPTPNGGRKLNNGKEACRVEIVLAGLIDDAKLTMLLRISIRQNLVELAAFERGLIPPVPEAEHELLRTFGHISQDNA